jgi:alkyl hydroperoxide reductase subunit AhpC
MTLGRNVNEYLRMVDAYTHIQEKEKFVQQTGSQEKKRWALTEKYRWIFKRKLNQ